MTVSKKELGIWGENKAVQYLISKGYKIISRNFRSKHGELDIIAEKDDSYHFVEVKTRSSHVFSYPEDSVTKKKQAFIYAAAEAFLDTQSKNVMTWQFDVIAIERNKLGEAQIEVFENAF